ncbi:ABC transporter permease [Actinomyces sp. B33]|uniref:ABC transporter permease n=1 Tax=Actinomyces sp. B33 TaxID=2942131 RepID=UPI00233FF571|nr:ABC transporter permease [Actinomyces sp. B33]MDC4232329.1 ABC transporter permease [Actinomyces sp. B33]
MFLAIREIRHQSARFALITSVIALLAYLTFFLVSLASGLAYSYRAAVDQWGDSTIILTQTSNDSLPASRIDEEAVDAAATALADAGLSQASPLASAAVVIESEDPAATPAGSDLADDDGLVKTDVYAWGVDLDSPLVPAVVDGRGITDPTTQVLADSTLAQDGWRVGDSLRLSGGDEEWTIAGFVDDYTFQAAPVILVDRQALTDRAPASIGVTTSALIAPDALDPQTPEGAAALAALDDADLTALAADDFVDTLPGYSAQILTFTLMIASLIVIASFVLGIFIYVLTLQKRAMLGVLKARGVPTSHLIAAGAAQTGLLVTAGVAIGLALTAASGLALPAAVPFRANIALSALITASFIIISLIGGLISVRVVAGIDPVEAIQ